MNKFLTSVLLLSLIFSLGACTTKPNPEIQELKKELEELKQERKEQGRVFREQPEPSKEEVVDNNKEKEELTRIIEELNKKIDSVGKSTPAPVVNKPKSSVGPGNANNTQGPFEGYLRIRTNSVDGKVNLRGYPSLDSEVVTTLPNGYSNIYYYDYRKLGDYVWYNVEIPKNAEQSYYGWLRGDFADR